MRLLEGIRLRIKDVDFVRQVIVVRDARAARTASSCCRALDGPLRLQLREARRVWLDDQERQQGGVYLPNALAAKYRRAAESWALFWLFPAATVSKAPRPPLRAREPAFPCYHPYHPTPSFTAAATSAS